MEMVNALHFGEIAFLVKQFAKELADEFGDGL
jgi:hypothetical protein